MKMFFNFPLGRQVHWGPDVVVSGLQQALDCFVISNSNFKIKIYKLINCENLEFGSGFCHFQWQLKIIRALKFTIFENQKSSADFRFNFFLNMVWQADFEFRVIKKN